MTGPNSRSRARRLVQGVTSLLVLVSGLIGVPLLLWQIGSPVAGTAWTDLARRLLFPDDGTLLRLVLTFGAWSAWAVFTLSVATEVVMLASRRRIRLRWPLIAPSQHLAAMLLMAVLALASASRAPAHAAPDLVSAGTAQSASGLVAGESSEKDASASSGLPGESVPVPHHHEDRDPHRDRGAPPPLRVTEHASDEATRVEAASAPAAQRIATAAAPSGGTEEHLHVVLDGDDLWSLAERYYGAGTAWRTIAAANPDRLSGGPDRLLPGWRLVIPGAAASTDDRGGVLTVRRGDTLSGLAAEHLGSAARWRELYRANQAVITDPDRLLVGLRLRLPVPPSWSDHPSASTRTSDERRRAMDQARPPGAAGERRGDGNDPASEERPFVTVRPGSGPESAAVPERTATGPGSTPRPIPGSSTPPEGAAPTPDRSAPSATHSTSQEDPRRSEAASSAGSSVLGDAAGAVSRHDGGAHSGPVPGGDDPRSHHLGGHGLGGHGLGGDDPDGEAGGDLTDVGVGAVGVSATLASALLAGLALRRRRQLAMRPVGRRIMQPPPPARRLEVELGRRQRAAALRAVDLALRAVAAHCRSSGESLPTVRSVFFDDDRIELVTTERTAAPPQGFTADGERWSVDVTRAGSWSHLGVGDAPRPYPALVSLGTEARGRTFMVDLEECRSVDVSLGPHDTAGFLAAVTAELSLAPWADELLLTVVGSDDGWCAALDHPSVQREDDLDEVLDRLHARAEAQRHHRSAGPRGPHRLTPDLAAAWTPEVLIVTHPPTQAQAQRLVGLLTAEPEVTAAAVVAGPLSGSRVTLSGTAEQALVEPLGIRLRAQVLRPGAAAGVQDLLATTGSERTDPAPWWADDSPAAPPGRRSWGTSVNESEGSTEVHDKAGEAAGPHHPVLRMLGPVDLLGAAGAPPTRASKQCLEYCAWLLEHPGTTAMAMAAALSVAEGTRRSNMSRLRGWLGTDSDGKAYLPDAYSGHIVLHPAVSSDWQRLQILTVGGVNKTSSEGLRAALELVRGAPLADAAPGQWHWAEELRTDMISAVRDIGVELAERALASGHLDLARWAAARALTAAPADERLMTLRIRTEHQAGNAAETERLTLQLAAQARAIGIDLDPSTVTTLQQVLEGRVRARIPV